MHDEVAIIGIGECAHDREAVPAGPEGQDQVVTVGPGAANTGQVGRIEVDQ